MALHAHLLPGLLHTPEPGGHAPKPGVPEVTGEQKSKINPKRQLHDDLLEILNACNFTKELELPTAVFSLKDIRNLRLLEQFLCPQVPTGLWVPSDRLLPSKSYKST